MQKEQVHRFYEEIWNANDKKVIPAVLHEHFRFRGSLGHETRGHEEFAEYVDMIHKAFSDYRCIVDEFVAEGDKVFVKMTFTGVHKDEFMGHVPTQKRLSWVACALFTFEDGRMSDAWVLGDLKGLEYQMERNAT